MNINKASFYENLISQSKDFFLCVDIEGNFLYLNNQLLKHLDYTQEEMKKINLIDVTHQDYRSLIKEILNIESKFLDEKLTLKLISKKGEMLHVEGQFVTYQEDIHAPKCILGTFANTTIYLQTKKDLEIKTRLSEIYSIYLKRFYEASVDSIDQEVNLLLSELGRLFKVDRVYIFDYIYEHKIIKNTYEWCNQGIKPVISDLQEIKDEILGDWLVMHQRGEPIFVDDIHQIQNEPLKKLMYDQEIQSLITQPIMDKDFCVGFIGFDSVVNKRFYTNDEKEALYEFANLVLFAKKKIKLEQELKNKEIELINQKQRLTNLLDSTIDMILEVDLEKRYVAVFGKDIYKLGIDFKNYIGKKPTEVFGKDGLYREMIYDKVLSGSTQIYEGKINNGKEEIWFETNISPIYCQDGKISGAVAISRNITDKKLKELEIIHMNQHDYLTGLHNRRYFNEYLKTINHNKFYPIGIMMMDLNGLKLINDVFGHDKGDLLLKKIAKAFLKVVNHESIFRIGGDEFVILMKNANKNDLESIINKIKIEVDKISIEEVRVSVGIGYAIKDHKSLSFNDTLNQAETNMYRNKMIHGKNTKNKAILSILKALTEKNIYEKDHSIFVSKYAKMIGEDMKLSKDSIKELELAALLHDIGKISISDEILLKPTKLTPQEFEMIKTHTESGYQILRIADEYSDFAEYALSHHERYDGSGYPSKLKGEDIPLFSRIIAVADAYEAMTSKRPFRDAYTKEYAISELKKHSGTQFDPKIVKRFLKIIE
jgi:diguanylate cyclase (GGDEF)-like protein/PAS domain S-box-containing protein/putative nucleotidyltransferase with HDIG domain